MSNARSRMATDILKALTIASAATGDRFVVKQEVSSQIGNQKRRQILQEVKQAIF